VLIEFDALDDLIGLHVDVVEDVAVDDCVDAAILSRADAAHRPAGFVNKLRLTGWNSIKETVRVDFPCSDSAVVWTADQNVVDHV